MRVVAVALLAALMLGGCFDIGTRSVAPGDYLSGERYAKWVIEVDYAEGEQPSQELLNFVRGKLVPLVHKESVDLRLGDRLAGTDRAWSDAEVRALASERRNAKTEGDTVVTHLLFLAGHSAHDQGDARVLGIAYGHDLIVIFSKSIKESCNTILSLLCRPDPYFQAVVVHEFGHILGLVNHGTPMVRNHEASTCGDRPDRGHSSNQRSVMYCQVETSAIFLPPFQSGPPTDFDSDDRADLKAAGGR